jgi:hypothetical protein
VRYSGSEKDTVMLNQEDTASKDRLKQGRLSQSVYMYRDEAGRENEVEATDSESARWTEQMADTGEMVLAK